MKETSTKRKIKHKTQIQFISPFIHLQSNQIEIKLQIFLESHICNQKARDWEDKPQFKRFYQ